MHEHKRDEAGNSDSSVTRTEYMSQPDYPKDYIKTKWRLTFIQIQALQEEDREACRKLNLPTPPVKFRKKHTFLYEFKAYLKLTDKKGDFNSLLRWHTKRSSLNNLIFLHSC